MVQERPVRVERRLSAILAADVAGYSRLMGLDEAGTARILREHRAVSDALVAKHGGRIVKTTGDRVLLEFPSEGRGHVFRVEITILSQHSLQTDENPKWSSCSEIHSYRLPSLYGP